MIHSFIMLRKRSWGKWTGFAWLATDQQQPPGVEQVCWWWFPALLQLLHCHHPCLSILDTRLPVCEQLPVEAHLLSEPDAVIAIPRDHGKEMEILHITRGLLKPLSLIPIENKTSRKFKF